ncbi:MAG: hypothetical protein JW704_08420 [Anaerolineaceae bacterium]|nr:hypothetical protein [Anaerolineaceae bacterium]
MKLEEVKLAIDGRKKLFFVEAKGVNQMVEGIPTAMSVDERSLLVALFVPAGMRVAVVDGALLGRDPSEAQRNAARRNAIMNEMGMHAWNRGVIEIEQSRIVSEAMERTIRPIKDGNLGGGDGEGGGLGSPN